MRVQVALVVFHNDVQKLLVILFGGRKSAQNSHSEFPLKHRHDLHLPVLVLGVLKDFFDCNYLPSSDELGTENLPEGPLTYQTQVLEVRFAKFHGCAVEGVAFGLVDLEKFVDAPGFQ